MARGMVIRANTKEAWRFATHTISRIFQIVFFCPIESRDPVITSKANQLSASKTSDALK